MIGSLEAVARFYRRAFVFQGRATRAEFWWVQLFQLIVYAALFIAFLFLMQDMGGFGTGDLTQLALSLLYAAGGFALINLIPGLALSARRFHDLGQTGWLAVVFLFAGWVMPILPALANLVWFAMPGTPGPNAYGPDPLGYDGLSMDYDEELFG